MGQTFAPDLLVWIMGPPDLAKEKLTCVIQISTIRIPNPKKLGFQLFGFPKKRHNMFVCVMYSLICVDHERFPKREFQGVGL